MAARATVLDGRQDEDSVLQLRDGRLYHTLLLAVVLAPVGFASGGDGVGKEGTEADNGHEDDGEQGDPVLHLELTVPVVTCHLVQHLLEHKIDACKLFFGDFKPFNF